jgi:hypothetical protein
MRRAASAIKNLDFVAPDPQLRYTYKDVRAGATRQRYELAAVLP